MNYIYIGLLRGLLAGIPTFGLVEVQRESTNYHRIEMGPGDLFVNGDMATNIDAIQFPIALNSWGTITHFGIFDSLHDGNILATGKLTERVSVSEGIQIWFEPNRMNIELSALLDRE